MMIILQLMACIIFFLLIPYLVGGLAAFFLPMEDSLPFRMVSGYVMEFALFQLIALPGIFLSMPLHLLVIICGVILAGLSVLSLFLHKKKTLTVLINSFAVFRNVRKNGWLILVILLIAAQTAFVVTHTHIDDDDAFYVASSETSVTTDTLMTYNPYTGEAYHKLPVRYLFSPFMNWTASTAVITGIKPAIICHTVLPAVLIPLAYMVYYLWARFLKKRRLGLDTGLFMLFVFLIFSFSGYSVYSQGMFMLVRIWQGKAILAAILLPAVLWYALTFFEKGLEKKDYLWFFVLMTACCLVSQMGIMLGAMALGMAFIGYAILQKRILPIAGCLLSCVCNIACAAGYILMK